MPHSGEGFEAVRNWIAGTGRRKLCGAVVKVPPSVGCVKYKAQDVVLALQILLFWYETVLLRGMAVRVSVEFTADCLALVRGPPKARPVDTGMGAAIEDQGIP
jgi:hypothetical protein